MRTTDLKSQLSEGLGSRTYYPTWPSPRQCPGQPQPGSHWAGLGSRWLKMKATLLWGISQPSKKEALAGGTLVSTATSTRTECPASFQKPIIPCLWAIVHLSATLLNTSPKRPLLGPSDWYHTSRLTTASVELDVQQVRQPLVQPPL